MRSALPSLGECEISGIPPRLDSSEKMLIGCSARNRKFSREFFRRAIRFIESFGKEGRIVIFDQPYAYNDAAEAGRSEATEGDIRRNIQLGDQKERQISRILMAEKARKIAGVERWPLLNSHDLVTQLRKEIVQGIETSDILYESFVGNLSLWKHHDNYALRSRLFLRFQSEEIPVLLNLYYNDGFLIDIYPGKNFPIFQEIESGKWKKELPLASKIAQTKRLTFITVESPSPTVD